MHQLGTSSNTPCTASSTACFSSTPTPDADEHRLCRTRPSYGLLFRDPRPSVPPAPAIIPFAWVGWVKTSKSHYKYTVRSGRTPLRRPSHRSWLLLQQWAKDPSFSVSNYNRIVSVSGIVRNRKTRIKARDGNRWTPSDRRAAACQGRERNRWGADGSAGQPPTHRNYRRFLFPRIEHTGGSWTLPGQLRSWMK